MLLTDDDTLMLLTDDDTLMLLFLMLTDDETLMLLTDDDTFDSQIFRLLVLFVVTLNKKCHQIEVLPCIRLKINDDIQIPTFYHTYCIYAR